jgi:hypothetical protein
MPLIKAIKKQGSFMPPGEISEVSESIAAKLVNNGYAEYVTDEPEPAVAKVESKPEPGVIKKK